MEKKALDINSSVWVSASAGSGKTTILVNRLLVLLLNNVDISKVLCITYTKTAASEMKDRIYKILSQWAIMTDEELENDIKTRLNITNKVLLKEARILFAKIIDNIDNLKIFTIHSFCQQIISRFPLEAGIYPNFELIDEYKVKSLIDEAIDITINNEALYEDFKKIILVNTDDDFKKRIENIVNKRKSVYDDLDYSDKLKEILDLNYSNKEEIIDDFLSGYNYNNFLRVKDHINKVSFPDSYLSDVLIKEDIEKYTTVFLTQKNEIRKPKKSMDAESLIIFNNEAERCLKYISNIDKAKIYELSLSIINIALDVIKQYKILKDKSGFLDFDDLLIITYKLLENTEYSAWVNYKLDSGIDHILVDEAQDTSFLQWKIVEKLTEDFFSGDTKNENDRTIFVVGDEKQSIFKFQGASPEMFEKEYYDYKNRIDSVRKGFYKINLESSYRSLKEILKFVDTVFKNEEYSKKISKLESKIEHKVIRDGVGYIELWPLIQKKEIKEENSEDLDFESVNETEHYFLLSKYIVEKIKYLVNSNRCINTKNGIRKIKYGDIMILSRKRNKQLISILISELNKNNIPNSGSDRINLFDNIIIKDIISLLKFVIYNDDDYNLANIIKSPLLNLKEEDLYNLCVYKNENETTLFDALKVNFNDKYLFLNDIIEKSKTYTVYDLIFFIINKTKRDILNRVGNEFNLILEKFYDFILSFENNNSTSIVSFVNFVSNNTNDVKKDIDFSDDNSVKIMTAHSSKGLQAPIVFLCEATVIDSVDVDSVFWVDNIPIYKTTNSATRNIKEYIGSTGYEEYCRLLYVVITRAENELYICGIQKKTSSILSWYDLCKKALEELPSKVIKFDFDETLEKIVYGEESFYDIKDDIKVEKQVIDKSILENIKEYKDSGENIKIISPSQFYNHVDRDKIFDGIDENILRGEAVHKLLEVLPMVENNKEKVADLYLNNMFSLIKNKEEIKNQVLNIINKYKDFFNNKSKAELPIIGEVYDNIVSGRIDRLVELDDEIIIIDYKNTKKHYKTEKDLPVEYIKQVDLYKKVLENIYSNKKIKKYILITSYCELIEIL